MREVMSDAEIHRIGVQIVRDELQSEGWTILDINVNPGVNPQIIARKNGTLAHVLVRTARHPKKGAVEDPYIVHWCLERASALNAVCFFAGLRVSHAGASMRGDEKHRGIPVKGEGILVAYSGLEKLHPAVGMTVRDIERHAG
jgi:hypothetical protein